MKKAFTLVELMIAALIVTVIFAALLMVMSVGRRSWNTADTEISLQQDLRKAMRQIKTDLLCTGESQLSFPADGANYTSINFLVAEGAGGTGGINWSANPVAYSLGGGQIIRTQGAASRVVANNISMMTFWRLPSSSSIVRVNLTAMRTCAYGRSLNASLDSAVSVRN
jgi:type II secretory pathway pseudopilin PulG